MLVCRLNPQHVYPENYAECPWCQQQGQLNFPPPTLPAVSVAPPGPAPTPAGTPMPYTPPAAPMPDAPPPATPAPAAFPNSDLAAGQPHGDQGFQPTEQPLPAHVAPPSVEAQAAGSPSLPPSPAGESSKRRGLTAAVIATVTLAVVATSLGAWFLINRSAPGETVAASTASPSPSTEETTRASSTAPAPTAPASATPVATATPSPSRTNLLIPEAPSAQLQAGAESRFSETYAAQVTGVSQDGLRLNVEFTATGADDLRRPETSCLKITGEDGQSYTARPTGTSLTSQGSDHYQGTLTFPALISGKYAFLYSCKPDYSEAEIGTVTVPSVGVSRFSEDYYAVVLGYDYTDLFFAVHGRSDLRAPETSCIMAYAGTYHPEVTIDSEWSPDDKTLVGKMRFIRETKGATFQYSCSGYTEVWVD